jgi:hypothetical protein
MMNMGVQDMNEKPEALRLADDLEAFARFGGGGGMDVKSAAELRRLHAENERLREALNRFEYSSDGHIKRYPEEEEVIAALRREDKR